MPNITTTQFAAALRSLADIYEAHPEMAVPPMLSLHFTGATREQFARTVRTFGPCEKITEPGDCFFKVRRIIDGVPVQLMIYRDTVCRKVRKMVEVDTWECDSILEAANAPND